MKKVVKRDNSPDEYVGTQTELENFTGSVAGNKFHVKDDENTKLLSSHFWDGEYWLGYARYDY